MPQSQDSRVQEPTPVETFCRALPGGLQLVIADTWANRRAAMIFFRCLRDSEGQPVVTYEEIAQAFGYPDRGNVHNYWAHFVVCGEDLLAFFWRRQRVDTAVVARCEHVWKAHPLWTPAPGHAELGRRWPELGTDRTGGNIRTAGEQVGFLGVQQALRRQLAEGRVHSKEPGLLEELVRVAAAGSPAQRTDREAMQPLPAVLESIRPQAAEGPASVSEATVEPLEASLCSGEVSPKR